MPEGKVAATRMYASGSRRIVPLADKSLMSDQMREATGRVSTVTGPDPKRCHWHDRCKLAPEYAVSIAGQHYVPVCWRHAIFSAVPLAGVSTVELAPLGFAFPDDQTTA
jgi:hypothetical protein